MWVESGVLCILLSSQTLCLAMADRAWQTMTTLDTYVAETTGVRVTRRGLQRPGTATEHNKTNNIYNQPKRPSIGKTHRSSSRHQRKSSLRVESHESTQHSNPARLGAPSRCV